MTIKEAAIIEVYTGICFLTGDKRKYAYEYASSLIGRPVYTHEFLTPKEELKKRSYKDFIEICKNLEDTELTPEQIRELKERDTVKAPIKDTDSGVRYTDDYICPNCGKHFTGTGIAGFCYHCGQRIRWED